MTKETDSISYPSDLQSFLEEGGYIIGFDTDTQHDFADPSGSLYIETGKEVRSNLESLARVMRGELKESLRGRVANLASVDSHAYDSWEFASNGGPFPSHCIKGMPGWIRIPETINPDARFIPMSQGSLVVGEAAQGEGVRPYKGEQFAKEALAGKELIFEKEVYDLFTNPNSEEFLEALRLEMGVEREKILALVRGYCTGGYCVDIAAAGFRERGYPTMIVEDAVAPIGGEEGTEKTRQIAAEKDIRFISTQEIVEALS